MDSHSAAQRRNSIVPVAAAAAVVGSYLAWLGWHAPKTLEPGAGSETGPYEPWQVVGLALTCAAVVGVAAWFSTAERAGLWTAGAVVLTWCADQGTQPAPDASLWPLGAGLLACAVVPGTLLTAYLTCSLRDRLASTPR